MPTRSFSFSLVVALAAAMMLGPFSLDTYLPAFPAIALDLGVSSQAVAVSVSVYIFALALGQLIGGPLSDRFGRKPVLLAGLVLFTIASTLLAMLHTLPHFLAGRALQAIGAGWVLVSVPAMVRDRVSGQEAAKLFSLLGLILVVAPAIAPSIGSLLLKIGPWMGIFVFMAIYSALLIPVLLRALAEKEPVVELSEAEKNRSGSVSVPLKGFIRPYVAVFRTRPALIYLAWQVGAFSVMMVFITHGSFIYQEHFGQSTDAFALMFGANIVAMFCCNLINRALLAHCFGSLSILQLATGLQGFGLLLLLLATLMDWSVWVFLPAMMITVGAHGALSPNLQACYMEHFPHNGGSAAALLGAFQFGGAGVLSALSGLLPHTLPAVILAMLACGGLAQLCMWWSLVSR
ncbi:multidrug effflux MFS transporter [Gilvimarinus sp. SDUM040013]|uniref:Bcr/CflA family efflux transporter n=1 Tax=Gilvimarinus gilvus TaxID=3058038 RepID=A0ABU4S1P0_9GAMM|nr:multidrug effflux MFS transporter [Gilvimarinus sp. SDUM040013]MDO3386568.1 multidrug effflux MFS transporter [Gilvimarinus sp. SDUM040013]MDX6849144.1 multidrug effflux MFS transporter [Gilvimarinus sp. SDUM040013]